MKAIGHFAFALFSVFAFPSLLVAEESSEESQVRQRIEKLVAGLTPQTGEISLPGG